MTEILVSRHTAEQLLEKEIEKAVALAQNGMQSQSENDYDRWIQDFERRTAMASAAVPGVFTFDANMIAARMRETDALQRAAVELRIAFL